MRLVTITIACVLASTANAQLESEWLLVPTNHISPANPRTTLTVSARFPLSEYAFAASLITLSATESGWSPGRVHLPPPSNRGTINATAISGITLGQIHFPPVVLANPANPLLVYDAEWSTSDFTPRWVEVRTISSRFDIYLSHAHNTAEWRLHTLIEGYTRIRVVPAPASAWALAFVGLALARRRRGDFTLEVEQ